MLDTDRSAIEAVATEVVDSAFQVHRSLGPGLLESVYQVCLTHALRKRGVTVRTEVVLPVDFDGARIETGYRVDMIVAEALIIENKVVKALAPVHHAQIITYLKLTDLHLGFLINWNVARIKEGLRRVVHNL